MRIQQVVLSYLSNAIKFTPLGGKISIISTLIREEDEDILQVQVKDNGVGISVENQQKLFKLFGYL